MMVWSLLEPDNLECEVKWALESIITNKTSGGDKFQLSYFMGPHFEYQMWQASYEFVGSSAIWQCRTLCLKSRRKAGFFSCIYIGTCPGVFYWIFISCHLPLGTGLATLKKSENLHKDPKAPWFQPSRSHVWPPFPRPQQRWQWWGGQCWGGGGVQRTLSRDEAPEEASRPCHMSHCLSRLYS